MKSSKDRPQNECKSKVVERNLLHSLLNVIPHATK
nr:MAG TPA: hypothetical protein [Caudoviricetes sp.]